MGSLVVMGVSGCGKSHVGGLLGAVMLLPLIEGDAHHSEANRRRMHAGVALTDADRAEWLRRLGEALAAHPDGAVLTCSALRASYRQRLREASPGLRFAWLDLDRAAALARVGRRGNHFFPPTLVASQFETLEPPTGEPDVLRLDALQPPEKLVASIRAWWQPATLAAGG